MGVKIQITLREGNTGILYYKTGTGEEKRFIPSYDLERALIILQKFYGIKDKNGTEIRHSFIHEKINWFPTIIAPVFWDLIYLYVMYREFILKFPPDIYEYCFDVKTSFRLNNLIRMIVSKQRSTPYVSFLKWGKSIFTYLYNRYILFRYSGVSLLFFRYGLDDFRTEEIKKTLDSLGIKYIQTAILSARKYLRNLFSLRPEAWLISNIINDNCSIPSYDLTTCADDLEKQIFSIAIREVHQKIASYQWTYAVHKKVFSATSIKNLYGLDDASYIYPLLYACIDSGIQTIGHQHGTCYLANLPQYSLYGLKNVEYKWFGKIVVWSQYWKDQALSLNINYCSTQFIIGCNKSSYNPATSIMASGKKNKAILIPYEFLSNTYLIGKYIISFQKLGYDVVFKIRPDEDEKDQVETYCLSDENINKIKFIRDINDSIMTNIDIIAGSYSTIIFDLIPYKKEIWILDTEFKLLNHMVDQKLAKLIRIDHLEEDISRPAPEITDETVRYIASNKTLTEVLPEILK